MLKIFFRLLILALLFNSFAGLCFSYVPSDPMYPFQDYFKQIDLEGAWDYSQGKGVVVAVLDSGVDINHPDLSFNVWKNDDEIADDGIDNDNNGFIDDINGWDFLSNNNDPSPKLDGEYTVNGSNHGTAIAGVVAAIANNNKGIAGVAFQSKIMPIRILDGGGVGDISDLIKAIEYAVNNGADIINLSLVGYDYNQKLEQVVKWAYDQGVLIIAATGNTEISVNGIDLAVEPSYPACYGDDLSNNFIGAVSSVDSDSQRLLFSNYGAGCVDFVAPGERITSLAWYNPQEEEFQSYYSYNWYGTSFATAIVSGVAALLKSEDPGLSPGKILTTLIETATNIDEYNPSYVGVLGAGLIDAREALAIDIIEGTGELIKLANSTAVYFVSDDNIRHLFANEATYWSWYSGDWSEQNIKTISQNDFDSYFAGVNITVRPGSRLVKFDNSSRIYAVSSGGVLRHVNTSLASEMYGVDYLNRLVTVQKAFETDYHFGADLVGKIYPDASFVSYQGSEDVWYIDGSLKRKMTAKGMAENGFQNSYLISDVPVSVSYSTGKIINSFENKISLYYEN